MAQRLDGRVIAITGASSGIGAATAVACAAAGMDVALAARRRDRLRDVAAQVERHGRRALVVGCDVQRDQDVQRLIESTVGELGTLDAVFANAGYGIFAKIVDTSPAQSRDMFETNFWGTVRCIQAAVPVMRRQGSGHLLICTSAVSEISPPMYGYYAATKAAQDAIAGAMRAELTDENIQVSTVHPIGTETEFFDVVRRRSPDGHTDLELNTPAVLAHSADRVARAVVRCLRRPRPEVWPSIGARYGLAFTTAAPRVSAWAMRNLLRRRFARQASHEPVEPVRGTLSARPDTAD